MKRFHGEIDRILYSAETYCQKSIKTDCSVCPFMGHKDQYDVCHLYMIRGVIGDIIVQDDCLLEQTLTKSKERR